MAKKNKDVAAEATTVKKEKKKKPALRLIILLVELAVIIGCVIGTVKLIEKYNNPKLTAERYFDALLAGDFETAYSYVEEMEDTVFLNKEAYIASMQYLEVAGQEYYNIYQNGKNQYTMSYGNDGYLKIGLRECEEKKFFVFKEYEVVLIDYVFAEDVTIMAPKDVTVSLNGIVLDSSNCAIDESDYLSAYETSYTIDRMYLGEYLLEVDGGEIYQPYSEIMEVDWSSHSQYMDRPKLADGVATELLERSYDIIATTYQDAINGEESTAALDEIKANGGEVDEDYNFYTSLKNDLTIEDGFFEYVDVFNFSGEISYYSYDYDTGNMEVSVELYYEEDYGYQVLDWWDEVYEASTDSGEADASFTYSYINGEWKLTRLNLYSAIYAW